MKLGLRVLLGFFLVTGLAAFFALRVFVTEVRPSVRDYATRPIDAQIWGLSKRTLGYRVYVTDATGRVVFDSGFRDRPGALGEDYSRWRDVARTLGGGYGARATREVQTGEATSVMYVAAPVKANGAVIGALTVAKPMSTVQPFIERAEREILVRGACFSASRPLAAQVAAEGT